MQRRFAERRVNANLKKSTKCFPWHWPITKHHSTLAWTRRSVKRRRIKSLLGSIDPDITKLTARQQCPNRLCSDSWNRLLFLVPEPTLNPPRLRSRCCGLATIDLVWGLFGSNAKVVRHGKKKSRRELAPLYVAFLSIFSAQKDKK